MTTKNVFLFVYGTLRNACKNEMSKRLFAESKWIGCGHLVGEIYLQDFYPVLIESSNNCKVMGEVVELSNPTETFAWLDEYEDYDENNSKASLYQRIERTVLLENGQNIEAWLYLFNGKIEGLKKIESGNFLEIV